MPRVSRSTSRAASSGQVQTGEARKKTRPPGRAKSEGREIKASIRTGALHFEAPRRRCPALVIAATVAHWVIHPLAVLFAANAFAHIAAIFAAVIPDALTLAEAA